jgi:hypothetical protein
MASAAASQNISISVFGDPETKSVCPVPTIATFLMIDSPRWMSYEYQGKASQIPRDAAQGRYWTFCEAIKVGPQD